MTTIAVSLNDNAINTFADFKTRDKLGSGMIALNSEKSQLLFLTTKPQTDSCLVIDLNKLNGCSVTKEYESIKAGDLKGNKLSRFLKNIFFNLRSGNDPVKLSVYNSEENPNADVRLLESKAKKWQKIVSTFLNDKVLKLKAEQP